MKIKAIETIVVNMPMKIAGSAPLLGGKARTSIDTLMVRIDTDEGVSGWGEAFGHRIWPATRAAIDTLIGPQCIGRDPAAIGALVGDLQRNLHGVGRNGPAMYALSAIDIALWDIAGKLAGLPLYRLLGGGLRQDLPAYASLLRYGDPAAVARSTEEALSRGYRRIKVHEIGEAQIKAARETAGPDIPLMVDCNCPWTVEQAVDMARRLSPYDLQWLEEPVWPPENHAGLAEVRRRGKIAVAAGENAMAADFKGMFEVGAVSYAQPSVTKVGGVSEMRKVITLAESFGVEVVPHSAYFGPGLMASLHLIAALVPEAPVERFFCDFDLNPYHDAIHPKDGRIAIPQGPGLGVDPDPKVIEKLRVR
ncbi:MAG: mandelate racemase/muconate lactonizing enzyme family protein [Proteobacteria bacterium]|nr:mandelate racemase/muconate lactonizing enzyme family protein [Pseudomonadota bacterium]MBU2228140.1 mandelate racemase/muconate lactonizing enzyme family protein [Pseudomonadota bacterium]MBU2262461.1 mandelate racemase/muconate lactonizing enzyme family protein [Pseudomonadota bacterium]